MKSIRTNRLDDYAAQEASINLLAHILTRTGGTIKQWEEMEDEIKRLKKALTQEKPPGEEPYYCL